MRSWLMSKFDNLSLVFLIVGMVAGLMWIDKHGNTDFEKWMETTTAGVIGCYLGLVTGQRQKWQNGSAPPPATSIGIVAASGGKDAK
jgi:LytS/YehU family sensor histidine kinase